MGEARNFLPKEAVETERDLGKMIAIPKKQTPEIAPVIDNIEKKENAHKNGATQEKSHLDFDKLDKLPESEVLHIRELVKKLDLVKKELAFIIKQKHKHIKTEMAQKLEESKTKSLQESNNLQQELFQYKLTYLEAKELLVGYTRRIGKKRLENKMGEYALEHKKTNSETQQEAKNAEEKRIQELENTIHDNTGVQENAEAVVYGDKNQMPFKKEGLTKAEDVATTAEILEIEDEVVPPADIRGAQLNAQAEVAPPPHTFWGKMLDKSKQIFNPELRDIRANQKFAAMSERGFVCKHDFTKAMKAGEMRAKAEQLEEGAESEARPGSYAEKDLDNVKKFKQERVKIYEKLKSLREVVESIKIGWFTHLKIDSAGYIINLPEGNENVVFDHLIKEKERLGAKGKIAEANTIVEQMGALDEYTKLLVEREKLLASAGQDNFLLPKSK